jgi:hypothetical protein
MKKLIIIGLVVATLASNSIQASFTIKKSEQLSTLIRDLKNYKTTNVYFHSGDLYEHSVWVAITINEWYKQKKYWSEDLTKHDCKLATLAGLLHDIGKGGDLDFSFYTKPEHPSIGQKYILGIKPYLLKNKTTFDFKKLFKSLKLSESDKKLVSLLVGAHHAFGDVLKEIPDSVFSITSSDLKPHLKKFIQKLKSCAALANYTKPIDTRVLKLAFLVSAADVKGAQPCSCTHELKVDDFNISKSPHAPHHNGVEKFSEFGYHTRGKRVRNIAINQL